MGGPTGRKSQLATTYRNKLEQAIVRLGELRDSSDQEDDPEVATTLNQIGWLCDKVGDFEKALESYQHSLEMYQRMQRRDDTAECALVLSNMACTYDNMGKFEKAIDYYTNSLNIYRKIANGTDDLDVATILNNIGLVYNNKGDFNRASLISN